MLKKIGQFLADIKNKIRPGKKISEESPDNASDQSSAASETVSPFDQLVQNLREQQDLQEPNSKADKTGEVKVPQELQGSPSVNEKPIPTEAPALAIPPLELVKEEVVTKKEVTSSKIEIKVENEIPPLKDDSVSVEDKTPTPQFDSIPSGKIPRFDSLPQNNSVFEREEDGKTGSHQIDLDSSQPLYKIPKNLAYLN